MLIPPLALLLCLGSGLQGPEPQRSEQEAKERVEAPRPPAPRRAIGGLSGFRSESTLTFAGRPELPQYALEATYVFPERARWRMVPVLEDVVPASRSLRYQFGAGVWELPPLQTRSTPHAGEEARRFQLQNELRRVAMTWPAELEWETTEGSRQRAGLGELGTIEAVLGESGTRPTQLQSFLPGATQAFEGLTHIIWQEDAEEHRWWPKSWTLTSAGEPIWAETIDRVQVDQRYLETFFLPADQRLASAALEQPAAVKLSARVSRRFKLPAGLTWPEALKRGEAATLAARKQLGESYRVNPRPAFELDPQGHPTSFELQLVGEVELLPDGWRRRAACSAWSLVLTDLEALSQPLLEALAGQLEPEQTAGTPFVRVQYEEQRVGLIQLVLPLREPR